MKFYFSVPKKRLFKSVRLHYIVKKVLKRGVTKTRIAPKVFFSLTKHYWGC